MRCHVSVHSGGCLNSLRPRQNGRLFADDTFKRIFLNENIKISTKNSLKSVPKGLINNIPALVLIMAWRQPGDKPLSEPMLVRPLTHICVTRPQWVNIKMLSYQYRDFHYKYKTVSWLSYLYNRNPHAWKDGLNIETGPGVFPLFITLACWSYIDHVITCCHNVCVQCNITNIFKVSWRWY